MDTLNVFDPMLEPGIKSLTESLNRISMYSPILAFLLAFLLITIFILVKAYLSKDKKVDRLNEALISATAEDAKLITELKGVMERYIDAEKSQGETRREFQNQLQQNTMMIEKIVDKILTRIESVYDIVKQNKT